MFTLQKNIILNWMPLYGYSPKNLKSMWAAQNAYRQCKIWKITQMWIPISLLLWKVPVVNVKLWQLSWREELQMHCNEDKIEETVIWNSCLYVFSDYCMNQHSSGHEMLHDHGVPTHCWRSLYRWENSSFTCLIIIVKNMQWNIEGFMLFFLFDFFKQEN